MSEIIIDIFEIIDINYDNAMGQGRFGQCLFNQFLHARPVAQMGKGIMMRPVDKLEFTLFLCFDISYGSDAADVARNGVLYKIYPVSVPVYISCKTFGLVLCRNLLNP